LLVARHDRGFPHGGVAPEGRFDLTRLDAEAPHLDLMAEAVPSDSSFGVINDIGEYFSAY